MPPVPASPSALLLAATLVGGIGLFLLGVSLLTEGLKLAAGRALERILAAWTRTALHGLVTGVLLTALLQSSTAMTVAAIGFVNAGLLGFGNALWVVFGSNLGSSVTGWLVAWLGFGLKIDTFALPFIGLGMALKLTGAGTLRGALGTTLTGFGVMFLGIDLLKQGFSGLGPQALPTLGNDWLGMLAAMGLGLALTIVLQASSATLTLVLTAVAGGMMPLDTGAAVVVGANVGTTLTGILAAIGATANAKRIAAAHVLFNVVTAVVAMVLLHPLLASVQWVTQRVTQGSDPVTLLVVFHTTFNALGVLLMWPLAKPLARFLRQRWRLVGDDAGHARYLDRNVTAVPELALQALRRETARLGHLALGVATEGARLAPMQAPWPPAPAQAEQNLARHMQTVERLESQIHRFVAELSRAPMPAAVAEQLPQLLRVALYYDGVARTMHHVGQQALHMPRPPAPAQATAKALPWAPALAQRAEDEAAHARHQALASELTGLVQAGQAFFMRADPLVTEPSPTHAEEAHAQFEETYQQTKARLLQKGTAGALDMEDVVAWLTLLSDLRRAVDQGYKATLALAALPALPPSVADAVAQVAADTPPAPPPDEGTPITPAAPAQPEAALAQPPQATSPTVP